MLAPEDHGKGPLAGKYIVRHPDIAKTNQFTRS